VGPRETLGSSVEGYAMAKFGKRDWAGVLLGLGGAAMLTLLASPDLPPKAVIAIIAIAGLSFSVAAYCFGLYAAPFSIGRPLKSVIVLAVIWIPLMWLLQVTLPKPSFPYIKPGVLVNPQSNNLAAWGFVTVNRGAKELLNVNGEFIDAARAALVAKILQQNAVSPANAGSLIDSERKDLHYDVLNPNTVGGLDSEDGMFYWTPGSDILFDERYEIVFGHTKGSVREHLYIKKIQNDWKYAMYLNDEKTAITLIKCRDDGFTVDGDWWRGAPKCLPSFPTADLGIGDKLRMY
jgi:hypothetical protein